MRDRPSVPDQRLLQRVRGEFREMPGLRLTARQAQRLWDCDEATCLAVLEQLVESRFLRREPTDPWLFLDPHCYRLDAGALAAAA